MNGAEFLRRLRKTGKRRGVAVRFVATRGKGSHGTVFFGAEFTVLKDRNKEIGPGLLRAMLRDLGLAEKDLG